MSINRSRRTLILGAAATGVAAPLAASLLLPETVVAASLAAPQGKGHRGPAHDWLDGFAARKGYRSDKKP